MFRIFTPVEYIVRTKELQTQLKLFSNHTVDVSLHIISLNFLFAYCRIKQISNYFSAKIRNVGLEQKGMQMLVEFNILSLILDKIFLLNKSKT